MKTFVVGVAGGTGSGKTTVARKIVESFEPTNVSILEYDSYYADRPDLSFEERSHQNFDHPSALDTGLFVQHIQALRAGRSVEVPQYDFMTHQRKSETRLHLPTPVLVVEGILLFSDETIRSLLDLKVFVDTDADIRVLRRVRRDMEHRGRTFESVREQYYQTVRPMHLQFVEPSKRWADIILPEGGHNTVALDLLVTRIKAVLATG